MRELTKNPDVQTRMNNGVQSVADIVRCTLGPLGRNVAIMNTHDETSQPLLTDDGVRVVEFALNTLANLELLGAKLVYSSSKKTEEEVGDGTTSTYLLAADIIDNYVKAVITDGQVVNPVLVRKGINKAKDQVLEYLASVKHPIESRDVLINIAKNSSGSDEIGEIVGDLRYKLGLDGLVNIRMSRNNRDVVKYSNGYEFSHGFVRQDDFTGRPVDCYDPIVLILDRMLMTADDGIALVNAYKAIVVDKLKLGLDTPMVVLANKIDGEALKVIYQNWFMRSDKVSIPIIPVEIPITSDHAGTLVDLSAVTGATVITGQEAKLDKFQFVSAYGQVANINTSKKMTYIVAYDTVEAKARIEKLVADLKAKRETLTTIDATAEDADLAVRISKLNGIAVTIEVGAQTDIERQERKLKYDDAVLATHAARKDGVVIGGGYTYYKCYEYIKSLKDVVPENKSEKFGFELLVESLKDPFLLIAKNSGVLAPHEILRKKLESLGLDADSPFELHEYMKNHILYINLESLEIDILDNSECRVYDPYLVAKSVIENAASAAALFISTENSVLCDFK